MFRTLVATWFLVSSLTLPMGCGGAGARETPAPTTRAPSPDATEPSGLPSAHTYAAELDSRERYWWQQPEEVVDMLRCSPGMTVADLGAGTGYFLPYLSRAVGRDGRVLALDASRPMIDHLFDRIARERLHNVTPVIIPFDDPALTPRSVDRILVVNTWHHLPSRIEYAEQLRMALRTGGELLVVDFEEDSPKGPPPEHRLTSLEVVDELESAGFAVACLAENLPYQFVVRGVVR